MTMPIPEQRRSGMALGFATVDAKTGETAADLLCTAVQRRCRRG